MTWSRPCANLAMTCRRSVKSDLSHSRGGRGLETAHCLQSVEEFDGVAVYDQNVVSHLELM